MIGRAAAPIQPAFVYRWGAEMERRLGGRAAGGGGGRTWAG